MGTRRRGPRRALLRGGASYLGKVLKYSPIAYWPLRETSGTIARCLVNSAQNGTYTGVTLANETAPDGSPAPFFDGANDYVNIYSASLAAAFNENAGTLLMWTKVNPGVWTDNLLSFFGILRADNDNRVVVYKNTDNTINLLYRVGGISEGVYHSNKPTGWFMNTLTWDKAADEMKGWYNDTQAQTTQAIAGAWAGSLSSDYCLIGAGSTVPTLVWHGWLAHCAIWDSALTPAQIADLATV